MNVNEKPERWGIVGGGVLGMTLAYRLAQRGFSVTLFEAADHLGGLASAWRLGDVVWDRHYHVILQSDLTLRALLADLDLADAIRWVPTRTGFYTDGAFFPMSNVLEFLRFPALNMLDKVRLGASIFYASRIKNWRRLERVSAIDWLERVSGRRTVEKLWRPLLRAKLGDNYAKASAAFIWAIIARMYAARRSGMKQDLFGYVPGGYARILDRFTHALVEAGVCVKPGHIVTDVASEGTGIRLSFDPAHTETFDRVAITLPAPIAARICPELSRQEKERLLGIEYQGILCASVLLKRPLAGFYITNITESWVPFTAVIEMSALVDPAHFGGRHLVYLPKYATPNDPAFAMSDAALEKQFVDALLRMYPHLRAEDIAAFRLSRARHVLALSTLNYSDRLPPMHTSVPGLHIVNTAHITNGTLNVNETVQLAERAAESLLEYRKTTARNHRDMDISDTVTACSNP